MFDSSFRSDYYAVLTLNYPTFISSVFQVVVAADEVLTLRAQTFRSLQDRSRRPAVVKSARSWSRRSRSWSSEGNGRSSSSCRVEAWRNSVVRTNGGSRKLRNQVLDEADKKRVRWRRDSEKDVEGEMSWMIVWDSYISSQTTLNNFTQSFMIMVEQSVSRWQRRTSSPLLTEL